MTTTEATTMDEMKDIERSTWNVLEALESMIQRFDDPQLTSDILNRQIIGRAIDAASSFRLSAAINAPTETEQ